MTQSQFSVPDSAWRALRIARLLAEIVLVAVIALLFVRLIWLLVAPKASVSVLQPRALPSLVAPPNAIAPTDRTVLFRVNPFETEEAAIVPDAPETTLNLQLKSVFMSTDPYGGSASIMTPDNRTSRFVPGDEILPGVVLERVLSDRVIIKRNGESEVLILGGRKKGLSVIGDESLAANPDSDLDIGPDGFDRPSPQSQQLSAEISDPDALLDIISPVPVSQDDRLYGYALNPRGSPDRMRALGLEPGDVLIDVNGTQVSELDIADLIAEIGANRRAMLGLDRAGETITLRLEFDE